MENNVTPEEVTASIVLACISLGAGFVIGWASKSFVEAFKQLRQKKKS
jgi:hypothetical protein